MQKKSIDSTLVFVVIALVIFGMIMISSVSVYPSFKITSRLVNQGFLEESNNYYYLSKNIAHVVIGLIVLMIFSKFPYQILEKNIKPIYYISVILLVFVLFFGVEYNGAKGWINLPFLPSIQPVEFAKIGIIMFLAYFIKKRRAQLGYFSEGFVPFFLIVLSIVLPLTLQPDFGSILIILPIVTALYFVAGGNIRYLGISFILSFFGALSIYGIGHIGSGESNPLYYISSRIDNFFQDNHALFDATTVDDGKTYQIKQGLLAIGSGGFFGLGFGKSIQKFGYLPEVQGDFIFSVIAEELGLFGVFMLLFAYLIIVYRGYSIARGVKDIFGKYTAFGITTLIMVQMFVNVGVNLNVVPLTGVTLPFVSYGGSSLISLLFATGILLNISRFVEYKNTSSYDILRGSKRVKV